jgi:hypothetical protein
MLMSTLESEEEEQGDKDMGGESIPSAIGHGYMFQGKKASVYGGLMV